MVIAGVSAAAGLTTYATVTYVATDASLSPANAAAQQDVAQESIVAGIPFVVGLFGLLLAVVVLAAGLAWSRAVHASPAARVATPPAPATA